MKKFKQRPDSLSLPGKLRYFLIVAFSYVFIGILTGISMYWEYERIEANFEAVAHERGTALFKQITLVREWNFQHGEVYVPVSEKSPPNPYLIHPRRDIQTRDGKLLTLVTPGSMIREIAELANNTNGVKYHLTDLQPLHPSNKPDAWEAETLSLFEQHKLTERLVFLENGGAPVHRFMAPLPDKAFCSQCHTQKTAQMNGTRGGISITMPADSLVAIRQQQKWRMLVIHLIGFNVIAGLMHLAARRTYRHFVKLALITTNQDYLIEERTADLSMANTLLAAEVDERRHNEALLQESEAKYRSVVENTHDGIAVASGSRLLFANGRLAEMLGTPVGEIVGAAWIDFILPEDRDMITKYQECLQNDNTLPETFRVRMLHRDPAIKYITVDLQVSQMKNKEDTGPQWVISAKDVSNHLRAERELQLAAAVLESVDEAIMVTNYENQIIKVNPAFTRITGYSAEEAIGRTPRILDSGRHDQSFFDEMWRNLKEKGHWEGEIWNRRKDGRLYVEWLSITSVRHGNPEDSLQKDADSYVATFTDITKRKEAEDLLRHRASHDLLTDLPNRGLFDDRLQLAISQAKRYHRSFALLYMDLDHFKEVNDRLGHAAGDELLTEAARRMSLCIRESDTLSRFGGDEFAAILSDVSGLEEVEDVASRIVACLAEPFQLDRGSAEISGSVGIAIYPDHGSTADQLKYSADVALYNVKEHVRNAYRIYSADLNHGTQKENS